MIKILLGLPHPPDKVEPDMGVEMWAGYGKTPRAQLDSIYFRNGQAIGGFYAECFKKPFMDIKTFC